MRAVVIDEFGRPGTVRDIPRPDPAPDGAVVQVMSTGVCRSDWHAWQGHDSGVRLPFVPGHEFAGVVVSVGSSVSAGWIGRRVTTPFVCACGSCDECRRGDEQVCSRQEQPGFTHDGSFAEFVAVRYAEHNLVHLPDDISFDVAATLGCRYATAWRAVHRRAVVRPGEHVAVYGCGGLGLSAVIVAVEAGASVSVVDSSAAAIELALSLGASASVEGAPHVTLECSGSVELVSDAVRALRTRGRHVQIGLLPNGAQVPMDRVIARELDLLGSHGLAAHDYPELLSGLPVQKVGRLIARHIELDDVVGALASMGPGVTMVNP
ncbi:alcohol dehydrogenase [Rhodococcoides trifolii]|uniref:Alcohol dehydrogenase n=1 Tax=Rhodococcoides trifolii TaxID=908250 RepID=A0A917CNF2_9NOCA|nr:alcohol dehydrogenase catalytic domain-containing protein [Rhodococcus trifolii]GGF93539.1 alcohol dehydrogenase [Rhodococcus trifolii]